MVVEIQETTLTYDMHELAAWKQGDKSLLPAFVEKRQIVDRQPAYHFGEAVALRHFHESEGWLGFTDYMLMPEVEPNIARHEKGRRMLEKLAPPANLEALRERRRASLDGRKGYGEPDLFLYKPTGEMMFVEVKKDRDTLKSKQLTCLAEIHLALGCEVRVVHLRERSRRSREQKTYHVEVAAGPGVASAAEYIGHDARL